MHRSSTNDVIKRISINLSARCTFKSALEDPFLSFGSYFGSNYVRLILRQTFSLETPDERLVFLYDDCDFVHNKGDHYEDDDENCQIGHLKVAKGSG